MSSYFFNSRFLQTSTAAAVAAVSNATTKGGSAARQQKALTSASFDSFVVSGYTNAFIGLVMVVAFSVLREKFPHVYAPRWTHRVSGKRGQMAAPHSGYLGWVSTVLMMKEEDLFAHVGLDIIALLKIFEIGLQLFTVMCVYNLTLLMFGFQVYSIGEIHGKSDLLWGHLSSVYLLSLYAMWLLHWHYRDFVKWRHKHLAVLEQNSNQSLGVHGRTVLVESIPEDKQQDEKLLQYFNQLFPGTVDSACVTKDLRDLPKLVNQREATRNNLEDAYAVKEMTGENPTHVAVSLDVEHLQGFNLGRTVDSIEHYEKELELLEQQVSEQMEKGFEPLEAGVGFVTFNDSATANSAKQLLLSADSSLFQVSRAPEPRDIYWPNMLYKKESPIINFRSIAMQGATALLTLLGAAPVVMIASLTKIEKLASGVPFMKPILDSPATLAYLQGLVPTVALACFMYLLPIILSIMAKFEGIKTISRIEKKVSIRFLWFQVINVLLVSSVAGSIWSVIREIVNKPKLITRLLASSLPNTFFFFTSYVMLLAFSLYPIELLSVSALLGQQAKMRLMNLGKRKRREALKPLPPAYGYPRTYSGALLVMIISMVFSSIAPMILPFSILFFGIGWFVVRYLSMYMWHNAYESGGNMWGNVVTAITVGLVIYQLTFVGVFYLKENFTKGSIAWPLPFITVFFHRSLKKRYRKAYDTLALDEVRSPLLTDSGEEGMVKKTSELTINSPQYFYALDPARDKTDGNKFDMRIAEFFQQPEYLMARFPAFIDKNDLLTPEPADNSIDEFFDDGPHTLLVQATERIERKAVGIPASLLVIVAFTIAAISIVGIIVFKEVVPPGNVKS
jgi:calcium permeable stress-gated cation channel